MENQGLTPQQQNELDAVNWRINFQQKIMEQLQTNPDIQNYFKNYNEYSVEQFIACYCQQKTYWHQHGDFHLKLQEQDELKWIEAAWWHMEVIQQKKLFDIQCMWRAEQVELPGVKLCVDFGYWQQNVLNCSFIDVITEDEIDLYRQYLLQDDVELKDDLGFSSFQDYEGIKQAYLSDGEEGGLSIPRPRGRSGCVRTRGTACPAATSFSSVGTAKLGVPQNTRFMAWVSTDEVYHSPAFASFFIRRLMRSRFSALICEM